MDTTGERIKILRKKLGLTQLELAKRFDVDRSTVASWEINRREPDFGTLISLAELYGVSTDYLLGRVDNPMEKLATPEDFAGETIGDTVSTIALSRSDNPDDDLPEEAQKQIEEFRAYIRQKYKKPE